MGDFNCLLVNTIQCVKFIWSCFFKWLIRLMMLLLFLFVILEKDNDDHVIDWLVLLTRTRARYIFLSFLIAEDKQSNFSRVVPRIRASCVFVRCSLPNIRKPNVFWITFCDQSEVIVVPLFKHMWQTVCLYLSMWIQLKWVGSDKTLESVLCLMDIRVIDNFCLHI